jgi:mRNA-degrading endonuclease HigB of HigAB toxin-antitoxin module
MRFLGQAEVAAFLSGHPSEAERLQAWLSEMRHRDWKNAEALSADFRSVDTSNPPRAIFKLGDPPLRIETLIDFRTNVVLLLGINEPGLQMSSVQTPHFSSIQ